MSPPAPTPAKSFANYGREEKYSGERSVPVRAIKEGAAAAFGGTSWPFVTTQPTEDWDVDGLHRGGVDAHQDLVGIRYAGGLKTLRHDKSVKALIAEKEEK